MKILLAVDGSPFTKRMLAYVATHDEWLGARHQPRFNWSSQHRDGLTHLNTLGPA